MTLPLRIALLAALLVLPLAARAQSTAAADPERQAALSRLSGDLQRHDYRAAIGVEDNWAATHPADFDFRHLEPLLHLWAGDKPGWRTARAELTRSWASQRDTAPPPVNPSFTVDVIPVGSDVIVADQCYEHTGPTGLTYLFTVLGPAHGTAALYAAATDPAGTTVTLVRLRPGIDEIVAHLQAPQRYADLRARILSYQDHPVPLATKLTGNAGIPIEACALGPHGTK